MIDFEGAPGLAESASDPYISEKVAGKRIGAAARRRNYPIAGIRTASPDGKHGGATLVVAVTPKSVDGVSAVCAAAGAGAAVRT
jgi:hypothetical protein